MQYKSRPTNYSEEFVRIVLNTLMVGVWVWDWDGWGILGVDTTINQYANNLYAKCGLLGKYQSYFSVSTDLSPVLQ